MLVFQTWVLRGVAQAGVEFMDWSSAREFIAGYAAGMALVAAGHPFDTVKVRLQTSNAFTGPIDCLRRTIAKEGFLGLYKGVSAPLFLTGVINSIMFGLNGMIVNGFLRPQSIGNSRPTDIGKPFTFAEAATTGAAASRIFISEFSISDCCYCFLLCWKMSQGSL